MARHVDRFHLLKAKVPLQFRIQERRDECAARGIDVQGNIQPLLTLERDQCVIDLVDGIVLERVRRAEDADGTDRVFVHPVHHFVGGNREAVRVQGNQALLDLEIVGALVPHQVYVITHDDIRTVMRFALRLALFLPGALVGQHGQHDRLGGAGAGRAPGLRRVRRVAQVAEHGDAAILDFQVRAVDLGVDVIHPEVFADQPVALLVHDGGHERCHVQSRIALRLQHVVDEVIGRPWVHRLWRQLGLWNRLTHVA